MINPNPHTIVPMARASMPAGRMSYNCSLGGYPNKRLFGQAVIIMLTGASTA